MEARYRQDYPGEFVVVKSTWADGKKEQQREWHMDWFPVQILLSVVS